MSMLKLLKATVFATAVAAVPARALAFDWSACNTEIKKHCAKVSGDEATFECLEKVEKKLSKPCYDAHEKYEKDTGKDKGEAHEAK